MPDTQQLLSEIQKLGPAVDSRLNALQKTVDERFAKVEGEVRFARDNLEKYTRQVGQLSGGSHVDPNYRGFWGSEERAKQFGEFVLAGHHPQPEIRRACAESLCKSGLRIRTKSGQFVSADDYIKAMGESSDVAGGYLVPDEIGRELIRNVEQYGVARKFLRRVPMSSERQSWPKRTGGTTVYYPDEGVAITPSDVSLGSVRLTAKKWAQLTFVSRELSEDSVIAVGELLALEFALALANAEDRNAFMGDGTSTYAGITGVFNSENVALVTAGSTHTSFQSLTFDDLADTVGAVPGWVLEAPDTAWFMSSSIEHICRGITDLGGRPILVDPNEGGPRRILGYPVVRTQVCPTISDDGTHKKALAFGSLRAWGLLGERRTMAIERSEHVKFAEDQLAFKCVVRQDIGESDGDAMAVLRTNNA
jgi:HK97 family phage major capsid protein